jgi:hypothetical protein
VPALAATRSEIVCVAPPSPRGAPGMVGLDVSLNGGADWSEARVQYAYDAPAHVNEATPPSGPAEGGTRVLLLGSGFLNASSSLLSGGEAAEARPLLRGVALRLGELRCRFGGVEVPGEFLRAGAVLCVAPPLLGRAARQRIELAAPSGEAADALAVRFEAQRDCVGGEGGQGAAGSAASFDGAGAATGGLARACVPSAAAAVTVPLGDATPAAIALALSTIELLRGPVRVDVVALGGGVGGSPAASPFAANWTLAFSPYDGALPPLRVSLVPRAVAAVGAAANASAFNASAALPAGAAARVAVLDPGADAAAALDAAPPALGVPLEVTFNGQD